MRMYAHDENRMHSEITGIRDAVLHIRGISGSYIRKVMRNRETSVGNEKQNGHKSRRVTRAFQCH